MYIPICIYPTLCIHILFRIDQCRVYITHWLIKVMWSNWNFLINCLCSPWDIFLRCELIICLGPEVEIFTGKVSVVLLASLSRNDAVLCVLLLATWFAKLFFLTMDSCFSWHCLNKMKKIELIKRTFNKSYWHKYHRDIYLRDQWFWKKMLPKTV